MKRLPLLTILLSQACLSMENPEIFEPEAIYEAKTNPSICYGGTPTLDMISDVFEIENRQDAISKNKIIKDKSIEMTKKIIHNLNNKKSSSQNYFNKLTGLYLNLENFCTKYFSEDYNNIEKMKTNFDLAKNMLFIRVFKIYAICSENSLGQLLKDDFYLFQQQVIQQDSASYDMGAISSVLKHIVSNQCSVTNHFRNVISALEDEISSLKNSIRMPQQTPLDPESQPQPQNLSSEKRSKLPEGAYRDRYDGQIKYYPKQSPIGKTEGGFSMKYLESKNNSRYNFNSTNTMARLDSPYSPNRQKTNSTFSHPKHNRQNTNSTFNHSEITTEPSAEAKIVIEQCQREIEILRDKIEKTENQYYQLPAFYAEIEQVLNYLQNTKDDITNVIAIFNLSKNMIYENLLNIHDVCEANSMDEILTTELYFFREQIIKKDTVQFDFNIISEVLKQILSNHSCLVKVFMDKISEIDNRIFSLHHEIANIKKNKTNSSFRTTLEIMGDTPSPELYSGETSFSGSETESDAGKSFVSTRLKSNTNSNNQLSNQRFGKTLTPLGNQNNSAAIFPKFENLRRTSSPLKTTNSSPKYPYFPEPKDSLQCRSPEDLVVLLLESVPKGMHIGKYAETLAPDNHVYKEFYKSFSQQLALFNDFNLNLWMNLPQYAAVQSLGLRSSFFLPGFIQALKENKTIKTLDITNATLTEIDEKCIADILEVNKGIELVGQLKKFSNIPSDITTESSGTFEIIKKSVRRSAEKVETKEKAETKEKREEKADDSLGDIERSFSKGELDEATYWFLKDELSQAEKF